MAVQTSGSRMERILEVVKKWRRLAKQNRSYNSLSSLRSSSSSMSFSSACFSEDASLRKSRSFDMSDLDGDFDDEDDAGQCPEDVPEGFLAVYVGAERRRFVISTEWLSHRLFKVLLDKSEQEYGFGHQGGLTIACDVVLFEHLVWLLGKQDPAAWNTELDALLTFYDGCD